MGVLDVKVTKVPMGPPMGDDAEVEGDTLSTAEAAAQDLISELKSDSPDAKAVAAAIGIICGAYDKDEPK